MTRRISVRGRPPATASAFPSSRARTKASIGIAHPCAAFVTGGRSGRSAAGTPSASASRRLRRSSGDQRRLFRCGVLPPEAAGGMRRLSAWFDALNSWLLSASPGTRSRRALSSRTPLLGVQAADCLAMLLSGPWHWKQLSDRIGRTSRLKSTVGGAAKANPINPNSRDMRLSVTAARLSYHYQTNGACWGGGKRPIILTYHLFKAVVRSQILLIFAGATIASAAGVNHVLPIALLSGIGSGRVRVLSQPKTSRGCSSLTVSATPEQIEAFGRSLVALVNQKAPAESLVKKRQIGRPMPEESASRPG